MGTFDLHGLFVMVCVVMISISVMGYTKDFGVIGSTWNIEEKDGIESIKEKLVEMEKTGELEAHNQEILRRIKDGVLHPGGLGIPRAQQTRVFRYDPTVTIQEDLKDAEGKVLRKAGSTFNPLDVVHMPYKLIFFNGEEEQQVQYALRRYNEEEIKPKLILTDGSPIDMEKEYGVEVYFDQIGLLVEKLDIRALPAIVKQENNRLLIQEVVLTEGHK
ncbi:type-F conjugative transfer system protein TraW [Rickettsiales endosymbiont of Peranema trichophorum]|uniref:type-F conjugative transfer system protein TraW n=1 Tax=Rickettsiales endosymbiont of Peranema trichophorum TaxID=2486577 RepID=UPI001022E8DB|nr:type-F conjugative transfer system protein TraW [Rickettsiales endosymbiont of Peranema trichophorum]RZI47498.1 type-F conjugative transfer system protein TraW [Rickettsiales endosymbiont of Peranema trichophorum]